MRRLLNGYAVSYSRRHRRHGELSISCLVADPPLGYDIDKLTLRVSSDLGVDPEQVWSYGKHPATVSFANLKLTPLKLGSDHGERLKIRDVCKK